MNKKLLIVDDEAGIVEVITDTLLDQFETIKKAFTIEEAISLTEEMQFEIIILDINIAGRNGAELIKHIITSENNLNKVTKILIISGIINQNFIKKNIDKFAGILIKPFNTDELNEMVSAILYNDKPILKNQNDEDSAIPIVNCEMPFSIPQLQNKVSKVIESANKNIKIKEFFKKINYKKDSENYFEEHIGLLINISTAISMAMEWNTDKTLEKFVYAAYLHDMALSERVDLAKIKNRDELNTLKNNLTTEDFNLVFYHPQIAAQKINQFIEIPSDVGQIVSQHHENPKENGFPLKLSNLKISPLSAIFITAHDMTDFILNSKNEFNLSDYLVHFKTQFRGSTFNKIANILEKLNN